MMPRQVQLTLDRLIGDDHLSKLKWDVGACWRIDNPAELAQQLAYAAKCGEFGLNIPEAK
jgi:hypothetical protein